MKKINFLLAKDFANIPQFAEIGSEFLKKCLVEKLDKPFKKKSGDKKAWSLDIDSCLCCSEYSRFIAEKISEQLDLLNYETILAREEDSYFGGAIIQYGNKKNLLILKDSKEEYGYQRLIKGTGNKRKNICIFSLMTSSSQLYKTLEVLQNLKYKADRCFTLIFDSKNFEHINNFNVNYDS